MPSGDLQVGKELMPPPLFANMLLVAIPFTIAFISNAHSAIYFYKTKDKLLNAICWSVVSSPFCYYDLYFHGSKLYLFNFSEYICTLGDPRSFRVHFPPYYIRICLTKDTLVPLFCGTLYLLWICLLEFVWTSSLHSIWGS